MACTPGMIQAMFQPQTPWSECAVGPQGPILRPHGVVRTQVCAECWVWAAAHAGREETGRRENVGCRAVSVRLAATGNPTPRPGGTKRRTRPV